MTTPLSTTPSPLEIQNPCGLTLPPSLRGGGLVLPYLDITPTIGDNVYLAPSSTVIGRTTLGDNASVWFGAVLRGDIAEIRVGAGSNIQDLCMLHVGDNDPCIVGANVTVGHKALLHGCVIEDDCLIGMGAIILNGAVIGRGSVIGAGALITQNTHIPPQSLVYGSPGEIKRRLCDHEREAHGVFAPKYVSVAQNYAALKEH